MTFDRPTSDPDDGDPVDVDRLDLDVDPLEDDVEEAAVLYEDQVEPEYGILGFTLRELIIVGAWLAGFIVSFFPIGPIGDTVWTSGIHWILMMGVPTAAVFLVVLRRLSPEGIRRVGSLGIDQFASVAASVAALAWAQVLWQQVAATLVSGAFLIGWVAIVGQLAMLVLTAATVFGPLLPRLRDDFHGRLETLAHRNANPARPVIARPRRERELVPPPVAPVVASRRDAADGVVGEQAAEADQPRAETALTMVIPDGSSSVPDARSEPLHPDARHSEASAAPDTPAEAEWATSADPDIEALHDIFGIDETTNPRRQVEHNTAPDGVAGSVDAVPIPDETTGPRADEEPLLRRTRTEPESTETESTETESTETEPEPAGQESEPTGHQREHAEASPMQPEPFWILAPTERDVLDEHGEPLFQVGPTAWALAIEDRGGAFVVRHEDGRIGYLHDISDITKG